MLDLNARLQSVLLCAVSVLSMLAAFVLPSFADGQIHINGIDPSSAYPNEPVRIYGSGAMPEAMVIAMLNGPVGEIFVANNTSPWVILDSSNLTLGTTYAGESGNWEISFVTPNTPYLGKYDVYVFDNGSLTSDVIGFELLMNITAIPVILTNMTILTSNMTDLSQGPILFFVAGSIQPSSGSPGTLITMAGNSASGGEISLYFDDLHVASIVNPFQRGDWNASFQVPSVSVGNHTVRAIDAEGRWMSVAPFYVTSQVISYSMLSMPLLGLLALATFSGAMLLMFLAIIHRKRR